MAHLRAMQWQPAAELLRRAVKLDTQLEFPRASVLLATALDRMGKRREAIGVLTEFLVAKPKAEEERRAQVLLSVLMDK